MTGITHQQAEALAAFLVLLRPGQRHWTKQATTDAIAKARTITDDPIALAHAAIDAAASVAVKTPEVIAMPGAHWEGRVKSATPPPERQPLRCATCHRIHDPCSPCGNPPSQVRRLEPGELRRRVAAARKEPA